MNNIFDLRSFFNFLDRNKGYTAIDVFGLSLSLMFVILIAIYVERELSIDRDQTNADCIWAISSENSFGTAVPVGYWLEERYPEIERVCPVLLDQVPNHQVYYGDKKVAAAIAFVDSTFFDMFSYRILEGDRNRLLADPHRENDSLERQDERDDYRFDGRHRPLGHSLQGFDLPHRAGDGVQRQPFEDQ